MQAAVRRLRGVGVRVGFVPTMGCLHAGHLALVRRARQSVGSKGLVVVSIYVNPTQFGPKEDFATYPRQLKVDARMCREAGTNILFAPSDREMYHRGEDQPGSTFVVEETLAQRMEGSARPGHFRGVTTVVAKLFNIVDPDVAVFGAKDYQQAAVVQRMVRDLHFRVRVVVAPTVREPDGLAMSSRNRYLTADERRQAVTLWQAIQMAKRRLHTERSVPAADFERELSRWIEEKAPSSRVDYIAFFDPVHLTPVDVVRRRTHLALAVFVGKTRLIDNARL